MNWRDVLKQRAKELEMAIKLGIDVTGGGTGGGQKTNNGITTT